MHPARHTQASPLTAWALTGLVVLVPLAYWGSLRDYTLTPKLLILQAVLVLLFTAWLVSSSRTLHLPPLGLPALCYLLANAVSLLYATDPTAGLLEGTKILSGFLLFLAVANRLQPHQIVRILRAATLTGIAVSLIGIAEYLGWRPLNIPSAGLPSATLGFRNMAAMYLIQNIPLSLALFAVDRSRAWTWSAALAAALMSVFLVYTRTRGAWIGLGGSALVTLILLTVTRSDRTLSVLKSRRIPAAFALALAGLLTLLPLGLPKIGPQSIDEKKTGVATTLTSIAQTGGDRGRLIVWKHTLEMVAERPLLGVGLGNWAVHYPRYDRGDRVTFDGAPERPHNDLLWILSELGLPGFLCYLWLGIAILQAAWNRLRSPDNPTRFLAAACLASLLAIAGHSLFSFPRERISPTLFFWLSVGLLSTLDRSPPRSTVGAIPVRAVVGLSLCLALLQFAFTCRLADFAAHMHRAVLAEQKNNWQKVAVETDAALKAGAFHAEAVHLRGYALNALGNFADSRKLYTSALQRRPHDIQMLNGMAIAAQNLRAFSDARAHYLRALNLVPDLLAIRYNLAGLYLTVGRPESAAAEYGIVLNREGDSPDLLHRFAAASALAGRAPVATEAYRRAIHLPITAERHFQLAEQLYRQHRHPEALRLFYEIFLQHWKGDPRYAEVARNRIAELASGSSQ